MTPPEEIEEEKEEEDDSEWNGERNGDKNGTREGAVGPRRNGDGGEGRRGELARGHGDSQGV